MNKGVALSIRVSSDAHKALLDLKKEISTPKNPYSISDLLVTASVITEMFSKKNPELVQAVVDTAKRLRLKKLRGIEPGIESVSIPNVLKSTYGNEIRSKISNSEDDTPQLLRDIIQMLIKNDHISAASDVLFEYKQEFSTKEFQELSTKILEAQIRIRKSKKPSEIVTVIL